MSVPSRSDILRNEAIEVIEALECRLGLRCPTDSDQDSRHSEDDEADGRDAKYVAPVTRHERCHDNREGQP